MATTNYGWTELELDDEPNIGQVNVPLGQIDATLKAELLARDNAEAAAYIAYTPGWQTGGTNLDIGNGTLTGRYRIWGRTVHGNIKLTRGTTTNLGSGVYSFGLPVTPRLFDEVYGGGWLLDSSAAVEYELQVRGHVTGWLRCLVNGNQSFSSAVPVAPGPSDVINIGFWYERI